MNKIQEQNFNELHICSTQYALAVVAEPHPIGLVGITSSRNPFPQQGQIRAGQKRKLHEIWMVEVKKQSLLPQGHYGWIWCEPVAEIMADSSYLIAIFTLTFYLNLSAVDQQQSQSYLQVLGVRSTEVLAQHPINLPISLPSIVPPMTVLLRTIVWCLLGWSVFPPGPSLVQLFPQYLILISHLLLRQKKIQ